MRRRPPTTYTRPVIGHGGSFETRSPGASAPPADARDAATRLIARHTRRFPNLEPAELSEAGLDPRDAAFAHAIADACVRRWLTLRFLLERCLSRPWWKVEPKVQAALLVGAAQLLLLDRVPTHAAIDETVEWAKRNVRPGAGGMVNAVLRALAKARGSEGSGDRVLRERATLGRDELPLSDGRALVLAEPILPDDPMTRLAVATSLPEWHVRRWAKRHGYDWCRYQALHTLVPPPTVLNVGHLELPLPADAPVEPHDAPGHVVWTGSRAALVGLLRDRADVWAQDAGSALCVGAAGDERPALIVDACAGRGTKTRQLAAVFPDARIVATDVDDTRRAVLAAALGRHPRVEVVEPRRLRERCDGRTDLAVLDVPCSNSGVLARRAEARYRLGDRQLERLAATQRQIIADAIPLLSPRGRILYSTCSLEPEENEAQVAWAARWHGFAQTGGGRREPTGTPGAPAREYRDGSFAALLAR